MKIALSIILLFEFPLFIWFFFFLSNSKKFTSFSIFDVHVYTIFLIFLSFSLLLRKNSWHFLLYTSIWTFNIISLLSYFHKISRTKYSLLMIKIILRKVLDIETMFLIIFVISFFLIFFFFLIETNAIHMKFSICNLCSPPIDYCIESKRCK